MPAACLLRGSCNDYPFLVDAVCLKSCFTDDVQVWKAACALSLRPCIANSYCCPAFWYGHVVTTASRGGLTLLMSARETAMHIWVSLHQGPACFSGQEPISWADLIVLSAKVAHVLAWTEQKVKRATVASGGSTIADAFGAAFPLPLGRVDATSPDESVQIPAQSASPAEVKVGSLHCQPPHYDAALLLTFFTALQISHQTLAVLAAICLFFLWHECYC